MLKKLVLYLLVSSLSIDPTNSAVPWQLNIDACKDLLSKQEFAILQDQYQAFVAQTLPTIAHSTIKQISIVENDEPLVNITQQANYRIIMLPDPESPFASPDCNSGFASAHYIRATLYEKLEQLLLKLDELAPHFGHQAGQVSIGVFEGLRDLATQKMLFDNKAHEIANQYSEWTEQQIIAETSKWISPVINNVPVHSTGGAIDIRLYDEQHYQFIDMGKFGAIWGNNDSAPTFSFHVTAEQMKNRLWLYCAALKIDLINYPYEFWHFSTGDRYAVYWLKLKPLQAQYGSLHK
jgi:hypothetical protein